MKPLGPEGAPRIDISCEELETLLEGARATLGEAGYQKLQAAIRTLGYVTELLQNQEATLASLRRLLCHSSTEKTSKVLKQAGIEITDARLSHLAYAQEIANAMLRRQQANAVIAARTRIVEGAVSMVEMALAQLSEKKIVNLDEERKAAMVSNLLVVLCSEHDTQPVVNAGTLYQG